MEVISQPTGNLKMEVIEVLGDLTGRDALKLEEYLYTCLDEGKCYQLLNLKHVRKIDGLGINVLIKFIVRGMQIRLFNVRTEIGGMIKLSRKENVIKKYKETDCDKIISLFEKEMLKEKDTLKDSIKRRRHPRIDKFFPAEFKFSPSNNGVLMCKANVLNLSKGGIFADQIKTIDVEKGKAVNEKDIIGRELHDLKFKLDGTLEFVESKGECVWGVGKYGKMCAGISFKDLSKDNKNMIRDYVHKHLNV
jgi:anti-anti-sigma regulatory factor